MNPNQDRLPFGASEPIGYYADTPTENTPGQGSCQPSDNDPPSTRRRGDMKPKDEFDEMFQAAEEGCVAAKNVLKASPPGVFETVTRERRADPFSNPETLGDIGQEAPRDEFDKLFQAAEEARVAAKNALKASPLGVFETVTRERRADTFSNPEAAGDRGQEALAGAERKTSRRKPVEFEHLEIPTDPSKLKALPTGFHDMTEVEQQEELWIVHAEGRLGRERELAVPGEHCSNERLSFSPSKVVGMLHRTRLLAWTEEKWRLVSAIARNRSLRLSVLVAHAFLRRRTILARRRGVKLRMERYLGDTRNWKARLARLERQTGITEAHIKQWLWILAPTSVDVNIQRFLASQCRKPLFLLQLLLAKDKRIDEPATFLGLLQYIRENFVHADRPRDELDHMAYKEQGRSMTWNHYLVVLYRLVWHCRQVWPAAMPLLARLTTEYISTMRLDSNAPAMTGYQARSAVLNKSLRYLSRPALTRPMDHMEHNWAAQRHLLQLAATAEPPLVLDQKGYRAVRSVLIALPKTKAEAKNADRMAKTWPPYRRTVDGIDERRDPEDDLSRSAKAGMLAREAGYSDNSVDRALTALGGSMFGQSPTIQTRSFAPTFLLSRHASSAIHLEWAAQVKATRNAREAWMVFENPPEPGLRPSVDVYGEMFDKLYARPVTESPAIRPGDAKEVFPVFNGNLSEFEIARLTPPSPHELYDFMVFHDQLKPARHALVVLINNAPTKADAFRYLGDSEFKPQVRALKRSALKLDSENLEVLSRLPLSIFNAWVSMLCRLHTRARRGDDVMCNPLVNPIARAANATATHSTAKAGVQNNRFHLVPQGGSIQEAIALVTAHHGNNPDVARRDRHSWHTIMEALAGPKMLYSRTGAEFNVLETLMTFLKIFERFVSSKGVDPVSFEALCLMIRKTMKLSTFKLGLGGEMVPRKAISNKAAIERLLFRANRYAVKVFEAITAPVPTEMEHPEIEESGGAEMEDGEDMEAEGALEEVDDGLPPGMLRYNVVGRPLHRYMMALACCGDHVEMVRLMDWLLDGWDQEYIREEAKAAHSLDYHYTMRTIAYFAEAGRWLVAPAEMARLEKRLKDMRWQKGCSWFWPDERGQEEELPIPELPLPELETDLEVFRVWSQLRKMVNFQDPGQGPAAAQLPEPSHEVPDDVPEQEREHAQILAWEEEQGWEPEQGWAWEPEQGQTRGPEQARTRGPEQAQLWAP